AHAQIHQLPPAQSTHLSTSASRGKPIASAKIIPLRRSTHQSFWVVVLKPKRCSSRNCACQLTGNPGRLSKNPTANKYAAIAHTELPKAPLNQPKDHGRNPLNSASNRTHVS